MMAGPWDSPPTEAEKVDPWAAPPDEAERVAPPMARFAKPGEKSADPQANGKVLGDLGADTTFGMHTARHLSFGLGDKVIAGLQALQDVSHDKTGKPTLQALRDAYSRDLAQNDANLDASDAAHPAARWTGNATGVIGSMLVPGGVARGGALLRGAPAAAEAVPSLLQLARGGAKTGAALGALGGFGASRSDSLPGTALDTGLGTVAGAGLGFAAPYAGDLIGRGAAYLGEGAKNLAGRLKVHSLHPTPTLGEKLADLPGGEAGAGRELLEQGLGGFTRTGTAEQIDKAGHAASQVAGRLARTYDDAGGAPLDIAPAIFRAANRAQELQSEPTTRAAGEKLEKLLVDYADKYRTGTTTAADALQLKRALGDEVYGAKVALGNGDTLGGRYGEGLAEMQRGVDDSLDQALGPKFAEANLRVRRLMGAGQAADRSAGKALHPLGLIPTMIGLGVGGGHGAEAGAGATLAAMLLHKYGAQAGAYGLYNLAGRPLSWAGGQMGQLASGAVPQAASSVGRSVDPYTEALFAFLRSRQSQPPALASMETP